MTPRTGYFPWKRAWACFFLFLAANTLLSYFSFSWPVQLGTGLVGIGLPMLYALWAGGDFLSSSSGGDGEWIGKLPAWVGAVLLGIAVLVRLAQLTTLSTWPLVDEGTAGYFALELSENWKWDFFYADAQWPPFFVWGLGLFFKLAGPSLSSLWLFPALLMLGTLPLAYGAAKAFFPRSFAVLFAIFWAFNFESLYLGRLCQGQGLEILWQLAVFALLGAFLRPQTVRARNSWGTFLGFMTGMGCFTLHHWHTMMLFVLLALGWTFFQEGPKPKYPYLFFLVFFLSTAGVYFLLFFSTAHGVYLHQIFAFHPGGTPWKEQLRVMAQYLGGLFWGVQTDRYAFKPVWGGFLNPVEDSFFFLGLAAALRRPREGFNGWILLGLVLFSLPALMTNDLEMLRTVLMLPLLLAVCVEGLFLLCGGAGPGRRAALSALLLGLVALNLYHLWAPYQKSWHSGSQATLYRVKSLERFRAYPILGSMSRLDGPGLVFTELAPSPFDQTFTVAVYPFNAARNPRFGPGQARWAALLTNANYAPFLSKRFPQSRWFPLSSDQASPPGDLVLGVIPLTVENSGMFLEWLDAERELRSVTAALFHLPFGLPPKEVLREMVRVEPMVRMDPFLESCLAERIFYAGMACSDFGTAAGALQRALKQGYPAANLFNDLGVVWWSVGDRARARRAFGLAMRCPLNRTPAAENLWKAR